MTEISTVIAHLGGEQIRCEKGDAARSQLTMKGKNMKKLVKVEEVEGEGLMALMGERVTLYCQIYIYTGKLIGLNDEFVLLEDASVVYETGSYDSKDWKDAQKLPNNWYVTKQSIESFGILK